MKKHLIFIELQRKNEKIVTVVTTKRGHL